MAGSDPENVTAAATAELVDEQRKLEEISAALAGARLVAVDTEFVRERTYYPRLCLIQVATETTAACIDYLADLDLEPLYEALLAPERTWLVHSARQDLEVIAQATGRLPSRLIDTQIAAGLAGYAPQVGLEVLLEQELGRTLGASYARTDWSRRPLPPEALAYARDDVAFLLAAWRRLESKLAALGRLEWVEQDSARLLAEPIVPDAAALWQRLKGVQGLPRPGQRAALALLEWREGVAQRADRPRRWILADDVLLAIAAALPTSLAELKAVPGLPPKVAARHGQEILAAVASRDAAELRARLPAEPNGPKPDKERFKRVQEAVRARAAALGIVPELVATRRDMLAIAAGAKPAEVFRGWRLAELADLAP